MRQVMYHKAIEMLRKAKIKKTGQFQTILERWYKDERYRMNLLELGWTEGQIEQFLTHLHWKIIPTKLHLKNEADIRSPGTWFFK